MARHANGLCGTRLRQLVPGHPVHTRSGPMSPPIVRWQGYVGCRRPIPVRRPPTPRSHPVHPPGRWQTAQGRPGPQNRVSLDDRSQVHGLGDAIGKREGQRARRAELQGRDGVLRVVDQDALHSSKMRVHPANEFSLWTALVRVILMDHAEKSLTQRHGKSCTTGAYHQVDSSLS